MKVDVQHNLAQVAASVRAMEREIPPAASRALNGTITTVRATAVREIRKSLAMPARTVRGRLKIKRATARDLASIVKAIGRPIPLIRFDARPVILSKLNPRTKKPLVGVSVKTGAKREFVPGAFFAKNKSGHLGVYKRKGPGRYPIEYLYGPSIPQKFIEDAVMNAMATVARDRFPKLMEKELRFELSKRK